MADEEVSKNIPDDEHLREDVSPGPEAASPDSRNDHPFAPRQTNAGQQVSGLASASGYGKNLDPEAGPDGNHPV